MSFPRTVTRPDNTTSLFVTVRGKHNGPVLPSTMRLGLYPTYSSPSLQADENFTVDEKITQLNEVMDKIRTALCARPDGSIRKTRWKAANDSLYSFRVFPTQESLAQHEELWLNIVKREMSTIKHEFPPWLKVETVSHSDYLSRDLRAASDDLVPTYTANEDEPFLASGSDVGFPALDPQQSRWASARTIQGVFELPSYQGSSSAGR